MLSIVVLVVAACGAEETGPPATAEPTATNVLVEPTSTMPPEPTATETPTSESTVEETDSAEPTPTDPPAEPTEDPVAEATEEPAVEFSAESRTVTFTTGDGFELVGTFYPVGGTEPAPTVLLLHMLNSNRAVWADFASELNANGYNALALDMRGHGDTGGERDWTLARADHLLVMNAVTAYPEIDARRMAVIGGSIGSNMSLILGKDMPDFIKTVALLSPGLDYRGVRTDDAIGAYGNRPILIVASSEDTYSADSSRQLVDLAFDGELIMYDGAGHGTNMFEQKPELTQTLIDWLNTHTSN